MQRSKPKAVLVNHDYYQALEQAVIDLTDCQRSRQSQKGTYHKIQFILKKTLAR